jgi:phospholipid transport system substrate-binding protein
MRNSRLIPVSLVMVLLALAPAVAQDAVAPADAAAVALPDGPAARALIVGKYEVIDGIISADETVEKMRERITELMDTFVDFEELSRLTVKEQWDSMTPERRTEYVTLFKQLIQRSYAKKFKPDKKLVVKMADDVEEKQGKARLETTVSSGGTTADVEYRMHVPEGATQWWVYDIVIDEVSLMRNYRSQFQRIIKDSGVDGLMAKLGERVEAGGE